VHSATACECVGRGVCFGGGKSCFSFSFFLLNKGFRKSFGTLTTFHPHPPRLLLHLLWTPMSAPPAATNPAAAAAANTTGVRLRREDEEEDADAHVPDHLRCCICWDAPAGNDQQCRNGHLLCGSGDGEEGGCLEKLRASAQGEEPPCPVCRTALPEESNRNLAVEQNKALLLAAAHDSLVTVAGRLIAGGAEVDAARPGDGFTPLCIACDHGNVATVERLIGAGSQVDKVPFAGSTPLFLAAQENRLDVLKLLIAAGADVNKARVDGFTPLHIAAQDGHAGVVSVLLETAGVEMNAALKDGTFAGATPSYVAAQNNRLDVIRIIQYMMNCE
jgi:hypothetical protein